MTNFTSPNLRRSSRIKALSPRSHPYNLRPRPPVVTSPASIPQEDNNRAKPKRTIEREPPSCKRGDGVLAGPGKHRKLSQVCVLSLLVDLRLNRTFAASGNSRVRTLVPNMFESYEHATHVRFFCLFFSYILN